MTTARLPSRARHVVIGAGVHGLSTARHLGAALGPHADVLVLDKAGIGAGASGIARGVVRHNDFEPAMRELMAHSADPWERHAEEPSHHPVGHPQVSHEAVHEDVAGIHEQQRAIGCPSRFVEGTAATAAHPRWTFPDRRAEGVSTVLDEGRGTHVVLGQGWELLGAPTGFVRTGDVVGVGPQDVEGLAANVAMHQGLGIEVQLVDHDTVAETWPHADLVVEGTSTRPDVTAEELRVGRFADGEHLVSAHRDVGAGQMR